MQLHAFMKYENTKILQNTLFIKGRILTLYLLCFLNPNNLIQF